MGAPGQQPPPAHAPLPQYEGFVYQPRGLATASLVLGIVGLSASALLGCLWFIAIIWLALDVLAIIFGAVAISGARRGETGGEGMARAGLICGIIGLLAIVVWFLLIIAGVYFMYNRYEMGYTAAGALVQLLPY